MFFFRGVFVDLGMDMSDVVCSEIGFWLICFKVFVVLSS